MGCDNLNISNISILIILIVIIIIIIQILLVFSLIDRIENKDLKYNFKRVMLEVPYNLLIYLSITIFY